ncbi:hypothetical protein K505DRAFT_336316 [Melanomma pulvis-pyrius CBS 109.77]|uniref:Peptidase metallopeptidase domain-containing protein n=1 Tax=Melanomma pulvis-pyrius CBS 109.77 TaxID=1314802 RepID=A0A6A6XF56_9PLEO|nr:hypothetical protein K505DRAFT_336316 [Melanomma pulvis-pyrius CBS 109.77]
MKFLQLLLVIFMAAALLIAGPLPTANSTNVEIQRRLAVDLPENRDLWPITSNGVSEIYYCYLASTDKDAVSEVVTSAIAQMMQSLGGYAGQSSGHRIRIQEWKAQDGSASTCTTGDPAYWDDSVPKSCLMITATEDGMSEGRRGWWKGPYNADTLRNGNGNRIIIRKGCPNLEVIHELGHTLGLIHEHQRSDRDQYVYFSCQAVNGYDDMKTVADSKGWDMNKLCTGRDDESSERRDAVWDFSIAIWNLMPYLGSDNYGDFDMDSFMIYPSMAFSKDSEKCETHETPDWCPLLRYTSNEKGLNAPMEAWTYSMQLSERDIQAIKQIIYFF